MNLLNLFLLQESQLSSRCCEQKSDVLEWRRWWVIITSPVSRVKMKFHNWSIENHRKPMIWDQGGPKPKSVVPLEGFWQVIVMLVSGSPPAPPQPSRDPSSPTEMGCYWTNRMKGTSASQAPMEVEVARMNLFSFSACRLHVVTFLQK